MWDELWLGSCWELAVGSGRELGPGTWELNYREMTSKLPDDGFSLE